jgi:hypothetical protein
MYARAHARTKAHTERQRDNQREREIDGGGGVQAGRQRWGIEREGAPALLDMHYIGTTPISYTQLHRLHNNIDRLSSS